MERVSMVHITLHRKLKIEQNELHKKSKKELRFSGRASCSFSPVVAFILLLLLIVM
jgi:hypothetical protein